MKLLMEENKNKRLVITGAITIITTLILLISSQSISACEDCYNYDEKCVPHSLFTLTDTGWSGWTVSSDCAPNYNGWCDDQWQLTLTCTSEVTIYVLDDFCPGDFYEVYIDGILIGTTPDLSPPWGCDFSGPYSSGSFVVCRNPGTYLITIRDAGFDGHTPAEIVAQAMCPAGFYVSISVAPDTNPPTVYKEHPEHGYYFEYGTYKEYIKCGAPIDIWAIDEGTCASGVENIYYRIWSDFGGWTPWEPVTGPISFYEECMHILQYYAVDNCGNIGQVHEQTYFVDCTPPTITKIHPEHGFYDGYLKSCAPIELWADDRGTPPCESGVENIFWRYEFMGASYPLPGEPGAIDGMELHMLYGYDDPEIILYWWYVEFDFVEIHFDEDCIHDLYYWAKDNVCNNGPIHHQRYYVDGTPPTITKIHPEHGFYDGYLKPCAPIELWADDRGKPPCESGVENLFWRYEYMDVSYPIPFEFGAIDGMELSMLYGYTDPAITGFWWYVEFDFVEIHFDEECIHDLYYWAKDNVCNNGPIHHQTYYVDGTPPTITKTHPSDYVLIDPDPIMTGWIKVGSGLTLGAEDGGTPPCIAGVENIFWRYEYDGDSYPESGDPGSIDGATLGILYGYTDPEILAYCWYYGPDSVYISFTEFGRHDLFYWAKDNVCNKGEIHHQIYWVNDCQPEVWVDDNFHSGTPDWWITKFSEIQIALDWLEPGGTAHVYKGVYHENIMIDDIPWCDNTGITLEGINGCPPLPMTASAIIEGTITIKVDDVTINNFVFESTTDAAVTVEANIDNTEMRCNIFLMNCNPNSIGVDAKSGSEVDARENWWGDKNGPNGGLMNDDSIAEGMGVQIFGTVYVEPWVGVHAEATATSFSIETGDSVVFSGDGSFAANFGGTYGPSYYWTFEPLMHSTIKNPAYVFSSPGTYLVSLRVSGNGIFGLHSNFMFDWAYLSIEVNNPSSTLSANAGGSGLGIYETSVDEPITLQGSASGGTPPYSYSWNLGDGGYSYEQNPTHTYTTENAYTISLTVTDDTGDIAIDTAIIRVNEIGELAVSTDGPYNTIVEAPVYFNSYISGGVGPYTYAWNFGDDTTSTDANPTHTYASEGIYTVILTVADSRDNLDTATTTITVDAAEEVVEIKDVIGGFGIKATISAGDMPVDWTMSVDGLVLIGGEADGIIPAGTIETVNLPFTFGLGMIDITVTAGLLKETYSAFVIGPLFLNIQES